MADRVHILLDDAKAIVAMLKTPPKSQWSAAYSDDKESDVLASRLLDFRSSFNPSKKDSDLERAPLSFMTPFLSVLKLRKTNIGAACRALDAMQNAFDLGIVKFDKNAAVGDLTCVVKSVVNNKGLAADSSRTEELISKSFNVLTSLFKSEWSTKMTDKDVIDVFEFGFKVIFDARYSSILHTLAETMLRVMVTIIFADLGQLRGEISSQLNTCHIRQIPVIDENQSSEIRSLEEGNSEAQVTTEGATDAGETEVTSEKVEEATSEKVEETVSEKAEEAETSQNDTDKLLPAVEDGTEAVEVPVEEEKEETLPENAMGSNETAEEEAPIPVRRGLGSIWEVFRFIANLIEGKYPPTYILMGLRLFNTSLDVAARDITDFPDLMTVIQNDISRHLLRLVNSSDIGIFSAANHSWHMLIVFMRRSLKFQIEKYFISMATVISSDSATIVPQIKDIALESLQQLLTIPFFPSQLFINYDLSYYTSDVFKDLVNLLRDSVFSSTGLLEPRNVVALDCLLIILGTFVESSKAYPQQDDHIPDSLSLVLDCVPSNRLKRKENIINASKTFNRKPREGIEYLIVMKMFPHDPPTPDDIADFLMATPYLDKRQIGNYICDRANPEILPAYINKFNFEGLRVDQALRKMLEAYRLPGEAAEIGKILMAFADHWFESNNAPFENSDAAYTLAYAVIMLNTDQHNPQVRRNQPIMDVAAFKRNLTGTNGGKNHDDAMLNAIFKEIKENEIIIPTEHTGDIRDSHEWEVLMHKSSDPENLFFDGPVEWSDYELFKASWGHLSSALFFAADKCDVTHESVLRGVFTGYANCVDLATRYGMSDVCDNVVIHLCKFASFIPGLDAAQDKDTEPSQQQILTWKNVETAVYDLSNNEKFSQAIRTMLDVVHLHGDHLRNAWKNVIDIYVQLYRAQLLPTSLVHVDDFVGTKGYKNISPVYADKDNAPRAEGGILSWLGLTSNENPMKMAELMNSAHKERAAFIAQLHPENLFSDSTYIVLSSLVELLDQLIKATRVARSCALEVSGELPSQYEEIVIFLTEAIVRIAIENKDRLNRIWELVRSHFEYLLTGFGCTTGVARRATVGLIRIANRNLFRVRDGISNEVMNSLSLLYELRPTGLYVLSRDIAYGLYSLLRSNATNVHEREHWTILFSLLEAVGAAVYSDEIMDRHSNALDNIADNYGKINKPKFSKERGYVSDDTTEVVRQKRLEHASSSQSVGSESADWIHLSNRELNSSFSEIRQLQKSRSAETGTIVLAPNISRHDPQAFIKVADALVFLLPPHITPKNFESAVQCLRSMIEAVVDGGRNAVIHSLDTGDDDEKLSKAARAARNAKEFELRYQQAAQAFIDLSFGLHAKVFKNYKEWAESDPTVDASVQYLWDNCWLPLIQAIARLCCDSRRDVRTHALTTLPRAILLHEFDDLNPEQWRSCFVDVLFPLLTKLLGKITVDDQGIDEIRVRVIQLVVKTFLQRLGKLTALPDFGNLLVLLMNYMRRYWNGGLNNDLVREAIPESVKNMLLVVDNAGVFINFPSLYEQIVEVLRTFLPEIVDKVMLHLPVGRGADSVSDPKPAEAADTVSPSSPVAASQSPTYSNGAVSEQQAVIGDAANIGVALAPPTDNSDSQRTTYDYPSVSSVSNFVTVSTATDPSDLITEHHIAAGDAANIGDDWALPNSESDSQRTIRDIPSIESVSYLSPNSTDSQRTMRDIPSMVDSASYSSPSSTGTQPTFESYVTVTPSSETVRNSEFSSSDRETSAQSNQSGGYPNYPYAQVVSPTYATSPAQNAFNPSIPAYPVEQDAAGNQNSPHDPSIAYNQNQYQQYVDPNVGQHGGQNALANYHNQQYAAFNQNADQQQQNIAQNNAPGEHHQQYQNTEWPPAAHYPQPVGYFTPPPQHPDPASYGYAYAQHTEYPNGAPQPSYQPDISSPHYSPYSSPVPAAAPTSVPGAYYGQPQGGTAGYAYPQPQNASPPYYPQPPQNAAAPPYYPPQPPQQ